MSWKVASPAIPTEAGADCLGPHRTGEHGLFSEMFYSRSDTRFHNLSIRKRAIRRHIVDINSAVRAHPKAPSRFVIWPLAEKATFEPIFISVMVVQKVLSGYSVFQFHRLISMRPCGPLVLSESVSSDSRQVNDIIIGLRVKPIDIILSK